MKYAAVREDYQKGILLESDLTKSPMELFENWFHDALKTNPEDANGMVLSTADAEGFPNGRVVLLKGVDSGFVWFTNYGSAKGSELAQNPKAALTFWWPAWQRQVRVKGIVVRISEAESEEYFLSRPLESQAGACASQQSQLLSDRSVLEEKADYFLTEAKKQGLKRPENWGGFRLLPDYLEFWQGRPSRLHDRLFYKKTEDGKWTTGRLYP